MTFHVSSRLVSRLVVFAAILLRSPTPAAAQSAAVPPATPGLTERPERLAAEIDRNRIDLHVPGAVVAIVRGDDVISPTALAATWTPQVQVGGGVGYGMGWFVRNWQTQRLIDHGDRRRRSRRAAARRAGSQALYRPLHRELRGVLE